MPPAYAAADLPLNTKRRARRSFDLKTLALLPVYCLAVATGSKSFVNNPVIGSPRLNRMGLHLLRRRVATFMGSLRRRQLAGVVPDADRAAFERDGFVMKAGYLDDATFAAFRDEIFSFAAPAREATIGDTHTRLIALDRQALQRLPTVRRVLQDPRYRNLINYVGSFRRRPFLYIQTVFSRACDGPPDIQSFYHIDTFYPTVKSWFYLEDVGEEEAAFTYVPGSHLANKRRLAWERRTSLTAHEAGDRLTAEGSFRISEPQLLQLGYGPPRKLPAAANTLVVADTSGIHRRSTPDQASVRVSIWAYSRSNPFLPWAGGDVAAVPVLQDFGLRAYRAITDRLKDAKRVKREWRWVGERTPLTPLTPLGPEGV